MAHSSWHDLLAFPSQPMRFIGGWKQPVGLGACCRMHSHPAIEIVYHRGGKGVTRLRHGESLDFEPGSFVVYAPNAKHDQIMTEPGDDLCIHILAPTSLTLSGSMMIPPQSRENCNREEAHYLTTGRPAADEGEQSILNLRATALLFSLIRAASAHSSPTEDPTSSYVEQAEQYISENFATIKSVGAIAQHIGISHDHLRHVFRAKRGESLVCQLNKVRIARARSLLAHSRLTLKEIASLCGFKDEYYFSSVFARLSREAPGQYRQRINTEALLGLKSQRTRKPAARDC